MTLVFMIAEANRLPERTMKPASVFSGDANGRITSRPRSRRRGNCRDRPPVGVSAPSSIRPWRISSRPRPGRRRRGSSLRQVLARRLKVHQQRHLVPVGLPVTQRQFDADVTRQGGQVDRALVEPPMRS